MALGAENGYTLNPVLVRQVAASYTGNDGFAGQFAQANRIAHRWMFTGAVPSGNSTDEWLIDLEVPPALTVPITVDSPELQPGKLRWLATWGPWAGAAVVAVVAVCALLTVVAARSRGKALAALGVSALLVGAAGWAGIEVGRGYVEDALNRTTGDIRTVAEVMVAHAEGSLHHWLNITLVAGAVLVVLGAIAAGLGGLRRD